MSLSLAVGTATQHVRSPAVGPRTGRDLRLDFFRGVALLLIFIDHVSGNRFAALTLQSMGFADAAEVFVFIAGISAVYAYRKLFLNGISRAGLSVVFARVRLLYLTHLAMLIGVLVFAVLAMNMGSGFDIITKLGLQPVFADPVQTLLRASILGYLPHYLDILPLYVLLLSTLPLIFVGLTRHPLLPLAAAAVIYGVAHVFAINLPNYGQADGWFLNPLTWLVVFVAGATTADLALRGSFARLPRLVVLMVTLAAASYVAFAFLYAAPWRVFPDLQVIVAFEIALSPDKAFATWHRLADIFAKAWLVAVLVPAGAQFMAKGVGAAISRAGRNSLPIFISGTFLSLLGSIILFEADGHALAQIGVTAGGVIALLAHAVWIESSKPVKAAAGGSGPARQLA